MSTFVENPTTPATSREEFVVTRAGASAEEMRSRLSEDSYLFFRSLVPAEAVLEVRRLVLELCAEDGWLDPSRDLMEGVVAPGREPTSEGRPDYMAVYRRVLKLPAFHDLPVHPSLVAVAEKILGGEVLLHPRRIGRITFPNNVGATTPPHQDFFYIRGSVETYSCWLPLGDCPISLGGLAVAPGSHRGGFVEHTVHSPGAVGGCGVPDDSISLWHSSDFEAGDALFFHSHTIHKALPNLSGDRLRLSTDNRYQRPAEEIDPGALRPHFGLNLQD